VIVGELVVFLKVVPPHLIVEIVAPGRVAEDTVALDLITTTRTRKTTTTTRRCLDRAISASCRSVYNMRIVQMDTTTHARASLAASFARRKSPARNSPDLSSCSARSFPARPSFARPPLHAPSHLARAKPNSKNSKNSKDRPAPLSYLTCPIVIETVETLTKEEPLPAPLWSSFAGSVGGMWVGQRGVYQPFTGVAEPIAMDGKTKVYTLSQCCVENRDTVEGIDTVVRHESSALSKETLGLRMKEAGEMDFSDADEWSREDLAQSEAGLIIFDGGSYSRGPLRLCQPRGEEGEGEATEAPDEYRPTDTVHEIESCLQWTGEERVRVRVTLSAELLENELGPEHPPELDVSLLRVGVCRESWDGIPGAYTQTSQSAEEEKVQLDSGKNRILESEMQGFWNEFTMTGEYVQDVSMATGLPETVVVYTSREHQRLFNIGNDYSSASLDSGDVDGSCAVDGGTLWLPHRVILQVNTPPESPGGLQVEMLWSPQVGKFEKVTRTYDGMGEFLSCTCSTAVKK